MNPSPLREEKETRSKLIKSILEAGDKASKPNLPESSRAQTARDLDDVIQRAKTVDIIPALNFLTRPDHTPPWLRSKLIEKLVLVPLRPDGVRATLEFLFSVHPSSTVRVTEAAIPQKRGANITEESLKLASNLLSRHPASVTPEEWFSGISPQLLSLLDGGEGPELVRAASYIIGAGILCKRASGVPGTAGFKFFAMPLLCCIKPPRGFSDEVTNEPGGIVDLSRAKTLIQANDLSTALHRLRSLIKSHPDRGMCIRLLMPILLPLWALASWPNPGPLVTEKVSTPALELLTILLKLTPSPDLIVQLTRNVGYRGGWGASDEINPEWVYSATEDGQIEVVDTERLVSNTARFAPWVTLAELDQKLPKLLDFISSSFPDDSISTAFFELYKNWQESAKVLKGGDVIIKQESNEQDPIVQLIEFRTLRAMMERFPEKLAGQPKQFLDFISQILSTSEGSGDHDDEVTEVALSLLSRAITTPGFQTARVEPGVLARIESSLDKLSKGATRVSQTSANLRLLLLHRDQVDSTSTTTAPTDRQIEDRKTYGLAITYITDTQAPAPVRGEGLNLISSLITEHSPVLDVPGILVLLSSLVADSDEYIYLHTIKLYTLLASNHPRSVVRELTDCFLDPREALTLDARLRFLEALSQVIQRLGETFTGALAHETGNALLSVAGRRGSRPKTEARQAKEAKEQDKLNREAADAWGGEVPDMSEPMTPEQRAREALRKIIVDGWESKRGAEDVRVRSSALSVLGIAVEVNVAGLGRGVVTAAVDLCINVLQLEPEPEKGILRRAAVRFVLSFVRALEEARRNGKDLGFGFGAEAQEDMMRVLGYVAETDNDGLAVQHARDVMESLENWEMIKLVPARSSDGLQAMNLTKLAGLAIDPESPSAGPNGPKPKPRIEEVE